MLHSVAPFRVVTPFDPAIENDDKETIERYIQLRDISLLKFREGSTPTIYHVKRLSTSQMVYLQRMDSNHENSYSTAFKLGLVAVENLVSNEGDKQEKTWQPKHIKNGDAEGMVSREEIDEFFDMPEVNDIGSVVYWLSFLGGKRRHVFVPPPSSPYAWAIQREYSQLAALPSVQIDQPNQPNSDEPKNT